MRLSKGLGVFILLLSLGMSVCWAQDNRLEELEKKVLDQQQQIQELETVIEQRENATQGEFAVEEYLKQPDAEEMSGPTIGYDSGFFFQPNEDIMLKLNGMIMWQAVITEAHTVQTNTIILRRNRLDAHAYFYKDWHARICIGFDEDVTGNAQVRIREAYVEYTGIPFLKFLVGVNKVPFSMEFYGERTDQLAIAYSPFVTVDSMPRRDAGIVIYGEGLPFLMGDFFSDYFTYSFGVYNGDAGTQDTDGVTTTNADDDFLFVASTRFFPFNLHEKGNENIYFHAAFMFQDTNFREDGARIRLDGLRNHEVYGADLGGVLADVDDIKGDQLGVDLGFQWWEGNLRIEGEFVYLRLDRDQDYANGLFPRGIEPLELYGVSAAISYFFSCNEDGKMGLEPLFKFSYTSIDDREAEDATGAANPPLGTVTDIRGQDIWEVVLGARFHFNEHLRLDFNWAMYDLEITNGFSNNDRGSGGGLLHSFLFQVMARW